MRVIGLTGGIASGKSTVSRYLAELGAAIIDGDLIAREVVAPGQPALEEIAAEFGAEVLLPDGGLNRAIVGKLVFADPAKLEKLNRITHPRIFEEIKRRIAAYRDAGPNGPKVAVIDAPLLIEAGFDALAEAVWLIVVDEETQIKRVMERDKLSREEALARLRSQMPLDEKIAHADHIIENCGSIDTTLARVDMLWKRLTSG